MFFYKGFEANTENQKTCAARISKSSTSMRIFFGWGSQFILILYSKSHATTFAILYQARDKSQDGKHSDTHTHKHSHYTFVAMRIQLKARNEFAWKCRHRMKRRVHGDRLLFASCSSATKTYHPQTTRQHLSLTLYTRPAQALIFRARTGTQFTTYAI